MEPGDRFDAEEIQLPPRLLSLPRGIPEPFLWILVVVVVERKETVAKTGRAVPIAKERERADPEGVVSCVCVAKSSVDRYRGMN